MYDKQIVFLGFGNQGAAQAQNLRDSGIPNEKILIANREDSYAEDAKSKNFIVEHDFEKAAAVADTQPRVFNEKFAPHLKPNATIVIASGYNVYFKLLSFTPQQDVVMVAPRMIGSSVRSLYQKGKGYPCFVSVEQDGSGSGLTTALALSRAIGATKAGAIASSAKEETAMDLLAATEMLNIREAFSVLKEAGCSDEALCYEMWMSKEPAEIFERAAEDGFIAQLKHHSTVSQYGQLKGSLSLDGTSTRAHFSDILHNQVLNGKFSKELSEIEADLELEGPENPLNKLYQRAEQTELAQAEKREALATIDSIELRTLRLRLWRDVSGKCKFRVNTHKQAPTLFCRALGPVHTAHLASYIAKELGAPTKWKSINPQGNIHTLRTKRSQRSTSRDRDRRDRRRDRGDDERRRRSHSRDKGSERSYRDRSRDRHRGERDRDRDHRRDRDSDRGHRSSRHDHDSRHSSYRDRDRDRDRDRYRDRDRDDKDRDRRRKRDEYDAEREHEDRVKRKKSEIMDDIPHPPSGLPPPPPRDSPRSARSSDRRRAEPDFDDDSLSTKSPPPPGVRRNSPAYASYENQDFNPDEPKEDDSEARSVFVSQLAARLTARDLGYFFEDKLGEGTVMDSRIVTDRLSRRSKGIGYVEFRSIDLVEKALALSGTVVMGLPIMVQLTESERNKLHPGDGLYVGSLHFNLTESDIKQVFEPFGELEFVDLHRDPMTGRSKGYAFVQYKRAEDARMALEQMEGFELAGRTLRVNTVHEKGTVKYTQQDSLDEAGGGNLNAASRQALMQKLARTETAPSLPEPAPRVNIPQSMQSRSVLLKNMFDPEEETEKDWDKDLADDVKVECENKYGPVAAIKVEKDTQGEIYVKFDSVETAKKAIQGLNGRWFGGRQVSAAFISDAIMQAHQ
ncbi:hypothetical protein D9613_001775 [Agrocybe pediades]|uniref:Uncharacterized protein n=1 Tax=Agrocybe pediades TaxID=84607 RepID=A0A8H4VUW4_9AGAR|nr:hypothetical protein D9613_001775 [Agrocybe pediades]